MKTKTLNLLLMTLAAIGIMSGPTLAATIEISPGASTVSAGDPLSLDITINDVADIYAFEFDLSFDPSILSAIGITEGPFLAAGGATSFLPGSIDNALGTVSMTGDSLLGPIPGVTGSGTLATIDFIALAVGTSPVDLSGIVVLDSDLNDVFVGTVNGSVNVVPEPSTLILVGGSLAVLGLRRRQTQASGLF